MFIFHVMVPVIDYFWGDFNTNLDTKNLASDLVNHFISESSLYT